MDLQWRFDPLPPSEAPEGGNIAELFFDSGATGFVRETLQNANDQQLATGTPVSVVYRLEIFDSTHKAALLSAMAWDSLRPHLEAVAASATANRLRDALKRLGDKRSSILCVTVQDAATQGLTGGDFEAGQNYMSLVKAVGWQGHAPRGHGRGGSWGLGKAVALSASGISTVLFSSNVSKRDGRKASGLQSFRLAGRVVLPSHQTGAGKWLGKGWLGDLDPGGSGSSVSLWGTEAVASAGSLGLLRPNHHSGTSIMVVDYFDPGRADLAKEIGLTSVQRLADDFERAAALWFWPAIGDKRLSVSVEVVKNGAVVRSQTVTPLSDDSTAPFVATLTAPTSTRPISSTSQEFDLAIPAQKTSGGLAAATAISRLKIVRSSQIQPSDPGMGNTIALVRGSGMVVQYYAPRRKDTEDPYFGILQVGLAAGSGDAAEAAEEFFRAAEPPSHEEWTVRGSAVEKNYDGAAARLADFRASLESAIASLIGIKAEPGKKGPESLIKRFALRGHGKPKVAREITLNYPPLPKPNWASHTFVLKGWKVAWAAQGTTPQSWGFRIRAQAKGYGGNESLPVEINAWSPGGVAQGDTVKEILSKQEITTDFTVDLAGIPLGTAIRITCEPVHVVGAASTAKRSGTKNSGAKKPGAKKPGAKKPGAKKPGAKKPGAKKSGAKRGSAR